MFAVTPPLAEADIVEPRWYLETYCELPGAGAHSLLKRIENRLNEWGKALFDALFGAMGVRICTTTWGSGRKSAIYAW